MIRKTLAVGIVFLFIASTVIPAVISYDEPEEDDDYLENLAFMCYDEHGGNAKYEYYKEQFIKEYSNDEVEIVEPVEKMISGGLPLPFTTGPMDSPWPMKCHDLHHTGLSPYSTADNPDGVEKWRFKCDNIEGSPVIGDDGTIYFGTMASGDELYALYPNGTLKWKYKTDMWIWSAPAIAEDGTIYIGSYDCGLYAINPNGTLKWRFPSSGSISSSPAIGQDGTIYFGNMGSSSSIFAINPDGTEKWRYETNYYITSDPAIGDDGTIYIGSGDNYLYALYPNGTLRWRFPTGHYIKGPPSIADDGTIYIGSWDDYLYALYPNGTMKWRHQVGKGTESNPSIGLDGTIYVGGDYLYAIYPNGTRKWTFDFGSHAHSFKSSPAIDSTGIIYIGTNFNALNGGEIVAVNPDGTLRWRKTIANFLVDSSPCIAEDGTIYIGSSSHDQGYPYGYLHAFGMGEPNNPPDDLSINGETQGQYGTEYDYTLCATDPDGDDIWYYVDWDDWEDTLWLGPYPSGEEVVVSHTWERRGTYTIKAKARDIFEEESDWAYLEVSMPINQHSYSFPLLQRLLERFPLLYQLLIGIKERYDEL